jgi:hypothetical protein
LGASLWAPSFQSSFSMTGKKSAEQRSKPESNRIREQ